MGAAGQARQGSDPGRGGGLPPGAAGRPWPCLRRVPDRSALRRGHGAQLVRGRPRRQVAGRQGREAVPALSRQSLVQRRAERQGRPAHRRRAASARTGRSGQGGRTPAGRAAPRHPRRQPGNARRAARRRSGGRAGKDRRARLPVGHGARAAGARPSAADAPQATRGATRGGLRAAGRRAVRLPAGLRQPHPAQCGLRLGQPQPDGPDQESQADDRAAGRPVAHAAQPGRRPACRPLGRTLDCVDCPATRP